MNERFRKIHRIVMDYEGGYVNHPNDPGGRTYCGISERAHPNWPGWKYLNEGRTPPKELVEELYYKEYYSIMKIDELPEKIGEYIYDFGINAGITRAILTLQAALGVKTDGVLGPITLQSARKANVESLMYKLLHYRTRYYLNITMRNRNFNVFFLGWIRRTIEVFEYLMNPK